MTARDLKNGRNGNHQYNIEPSAPPVLKLKKDGTPAKVQPKASKPAFRVPGATTISGMLDKGGLPWAAARITAEEAVFCPDNWRGMADADAVEYLRLKFRKEWDRKAATGTIVHEVALAWAQNLDADILALVDLDEHGKERKWTQAERIEVLARVNGCVDALERFYEVEEPTWVHAEQTVIHPGQHYAGEWPYVVDPETAYSGCFDTEGYIKSLPGLWLFDWKTGGRYPTETILQLALYRNAPLIGIYDDAGRLIEVKPHQRPERCGVVYLHDTGTYELLELPVDEAAFERAMALRVTHAWLAEMRAWEKAHPAPELEENADSGEIVETPTTESEIAA